MFFVCHFVVTFCCVCVFFTRLAERARQRAGQGEGEGPARADHARLDPRHVPARGRFHRQRGQLKTVSFMYDGDWSTKK